MKLDRILHNFGTRGLPARLRAILWHQLALAPGAIARSAKVLAGAVCLAALIHSTAIASFVVGGFNSNRGGLANVANGIYIDDAHAALFNNFDVDGIVSTSTLTPEFLAGVDVLILAAAKTDSIPIVPLSVDEQSALLEFVKAGGSALLVGEGPSNIRSRLPNVDARRSEYRSSTTARRLAYRLGDSACAPRYEWSLRRGAAVSRLRFR